MAMNGLDIASYQSSLNLLNISYDFVMIKATEGVSYVNPFCDVHYQEAKANGKKRAIYHFFDFTVDAIAQANFFVDNCAGYIHDAIFVLDWEGAHVDRLGDAMLFLRQVEQRIGYKPAIYMSEYVENHYDWADIARLSYGLVLAKYSDYEIDNNYDMSKAGVAPSCVHWPFYFMWQWTSKGHLNGYAGDLDCDVAYLTPEQWDLYAGVQAAAPAPLPVTEPVTEPTTTTTTTEAPAPVEPDPTTTTTTADLPQSEPSTATTTTTQAPDVRPVGQGVWAAVWSIIVAVINRLRGVNS